MLKKYGWLWVLLSVYSLPAQAIRCGVYVVTEGDHAYSVLQKCGEPQYREERIEYREVRFRSGNLGTGMEQAQLVPIQVQEWLYNFGPNMFMQLIRLENGRVVEIKALEKGR